MSCLKFKAKEPKLWGICDLPVPGAVAMTAQSNLNVGELSWTKVSSVFRGALVQLQLFVFKTLFCGALNVALFLFQYQRNVRRLGNTSVQ